MNYYFQSRLDLIFILITLDTNEMKYRVTNGIFVLYFQWC